MHCLHHNKSISARVSHLFKMSWWPIYIYIFVEQFKAFWHCNPFFILTIRWQTTSLVGEEVVWLSYEEQCLDGQTNTIYSIPVERPILSRNTLYQYIQALSPVVLYVCVNVSTICYLLTIKYSGTPWLVEINAVPLRKPWLYNRKTTGNSNIY